MKDTKYPIQEKGYNTKELQGIINRNKHRGPAYCIKIMGLASYAAHEWQDKAQSTKTVAIPTNVSMKLNYRKTEKLTDHSRRIPSEYVRDTESLIKVELHMSTIIGADHTTYPAVPKNMTNYR